MSPCDGSDGVGLGVAGVLGPGVAGVVGKGAGGVADDDFFESEDTATAVTVPATNARTSNVTSTHRPVRRLGGSLPMPVGQP